MRDGNTFAKRQRETKKRQKAEDKRTLRRKRKEFGPDPVNPNPDAADLAYSQDEPNSEAGEPVQDLQP
jgi:hypothetical protein